MSKWQKKEPMKEEKKAGKSCSSSNYGIYSAETKKNKLADMPNLGVIFRLQKENMALLVLVLPWLIGGRKHYVYDCW